MSNLEEISMEGDAINNGNSPRDSRDDRSLYRKALDGASNFIVDVSAGWTFYTPTSAAIEYLSGMDSDEILHSRSIALGVHTIVMRPVGWMRNKLAQKWGVYEDSSWYDKLKVNAVASVPLQALCYTGMLKYIGAEPKEIAVALPGCLLASIALSQPFGAWQDKWRKIWGKEKAIKKK